MSCFTCIFLFPSYSKVDADTKKGKAETVRTQDDLEMLDKGKVLVIINIFHKLFAITTNCCYLNYLECPNFTNVIHVTDMSRQTNVVNKSMKCYSLTRNNYKR